MYVTSRLKSYQGGKTNQLTCNNTVYRFCRMHTTDSYCKGENIQIPIFTYFLHETHIAHRTDVSREMVRLATRMGDSW